MVLANHTCEAINDLKTDQEYFFSGPFDAHRIGWIVSGSTAAVATIITLVNVFLHARNYYVPKEQRQILRILLMPAVYGIVSFFSYRFFRAYTYYTLALVVYEALVIAAFLLLLLQYIGESDEEQKKVLLSKEKARIPIPFCCIRYRPSKPYFLHALKWSVLQYSFLRPLISLAAIITNALNLYCPTTYSIYFSKVYLEAVDFASISVALYGLIVFYALVKDRLMGRQPLSKFMSIKGIIFFTFYQGFIFSILQTHGAIKASTYWTATNVADGLQALCTCCEMVIFALIFLWSFSSKPYRSQRPLGAPHTNPFWPILDSLNYADFFLEGWRGIVFTCRFIAGRPGTRASNTGGFNIDNAFSFGAMEKSHQDHDSGESTLMSQKQTPMTAIKSDYRNGSNPQDNSHNTHEREFQPLPLAGGYTATSATTTATPTATTGRFEPLQEGNNLNSGMYDKSAQSHGYRGSEDANVDHGHREDRSNYAGEGTATSGDQHLPQSPVDARAGNGYGGEARGVSRYGEPVDDVSAQSKGVSGYGQAM